MHHSNNVVIMQTEQLGRIEALEEELRVEWRFGFMPVRRQPATAY